ncbi:transcriptional regulator, TetR family [Corynebacterium glucuronolyticum]|nr:Biofilm operon icaADBC HTH-type negative transcriptional regulator IcaR [Corynebacterium glucuronolyticum DSM 44120]SMB77521.1 transcriptional regulator, TetR family [Corynebacterium glucuronolyticum]
MIYCMARKRMTGEQRREQLLRIGLSLFSERGLDGTSMEEISSRAGVSKPVVYEHFGSKEKLYAEVVKREVTHLKELTEEAMVEGSSRYRIEKVTLTLLTYVEEHPDGFRILVRDVPLEEEKSFSTLLGEVTNRASAYLAESFKRTNLDPSFAALYAQALVGMISGTAQWWLDVREPAKEVVAAHIVNLCWNGLKDMEAAPSLKLLASDTKSGEGHISAPDAAV